jgi:glyoxylase-like metal-dependent hydrolase (beta-lactamase superfamily II)
VYGLQTVAEGLVQITLPPHEPRVGLPFGTPYNVFLLQGAAPTLVDTGHSGAANALRVALAELGTAPELVGRVLLTSARPDAAGNVSLFPNASFVAASAPESWAAHAADSIQPYIQVARELLASPDRNPDWSASTIDEFEGAMTAATIEIDPVLAPDGAAVATSRGPLLIRHTPGVDPHAACFIDAERNQIFAGATVVPPSTVRVQSPKSYGTSLQAISELTPDLVFSAHGAVQTSYYAIFRSLNLSVSNLVQNMPFALQGATPVARIAYNDVGYWPSDLMRFAATVYRFKVMLDELVVSGVAAVSGEGAWAEYTMDRPSRY